MVVLFDEVPCTVCWILLRWIAELEVTRVGVGEDKSSVERRGSELCSETFTFVLGPGTLAGI